MAKDEQELQGLMARIQGQQATSEEQLARMEAEMLTEITAELSALADICLLMFNANEFVYVY